MKYKVGDKIEFVLNGFLTKGEIIEIKKGFFKRYRVTYKTFNIANYRSPVIWVKPKDIIGIDNGRDNEGNIKMKPPGMQGKNNL